MIHLRPAFIKNTEYAMGLVSEKYGQVLEWDTEEQTVPSISELNRLSLLYKTNLDSVSWALKKCSR